MDALNIVKSYTFSSFCSSNNSDSNPYFHFQQPEKNVVGYFVNQMTAVNSVYVIDSRNNQIAFIESPVEEEEPVTRVAVVPPGNYILNTFLTALGLAMTTAGTDTYTVTNDSLVNRLTITSGIEFIIVNVLNNCYYESGFVATTVFANTAVGTSSFDLSGLKTIQLVSFNFNGSSVVVNQNYTVLASIPVQAPYQGIISYNPNCVFVTCQTETLANIQFYLLDERFRPITLDKSWSCQLLLQLQ